MQIPPQCRPFRPRGGECPAPGNMRPSPCSCIGKETVNEEIWWLKTGSNTTATAEIWCGRGVPGARAARLAGLIKTSLLLAGNGRCRGFPQSPHDWYWSWSIGEDSRPKYEPGTRCSTNGILLLMTIVHRPSEKCPETSADIEHS